MNQKPYSNRKWLRLAVHLLSWLPLVILIWLALSDGLGFNPIETALRWTGRLAVIWLLLSLTCTPLNKIFKLPRIGRLRKPLGLYAAMYAALHFAAFAIWDYGLQIDAIWSEILNKPFILLGLAALVILGILAATSFQYWRRKLGKKWTWLHRLVYAAAVLVIAHYLLAVKGDLFSLQGNYLPPLIAGGVLVLLFLLRITPINRFLEQSFRKKSNPINDA